MNKRGEEKGREREKDRHRKLCDFTFALDGRGKRCDRSRAGKQKARYKRIEIKKS